MGGKKFLTTGLSSWSSVLMETSVLKPGTGSSMWASRCRKLQPRCDVTNLWSFFQDYRWLAFPCNPWISCLVFQTHRRLVSLQKESAGPRTQPAAAPREPAEPEQEPKPESSKKHHFSLLFTFSYIDETPAKCCTLRKDWMFLKWASSETRVRSSR